MLARLHSAIVYYRWFLHVSCLLTGVGLIAATTAVAAAEHELGRRHSLIHRQELTPTTITSANSAQFSTAPSTPAPHALPRKLTKRPGLATATAPTTTPQQNSAPAMQPLPLLQTTPASRDTRITAAGTSLATQPLLPISTAAPVSGTLSGITGTATPLSTASLPLAKTSGSGAFAGVGAGAAAAASSGSGIAAGRSLQRLAGQMPGLSQLLVPTVSASSPLPSSPPASPPAPPPSGTGSATLSWTLNSESDLAGYKIYVGTAPGQYNYPGSPILIGRSDSYTVSSLPFGQTYFFAVSAYNYSGAESGLSGEVSKSLY